MIRYYASEDAGLPALTYSLTVGLYRFTNFKLILKACLVNGYGAKAAAGWTLIDEGDLFIVLRNSTGKYVTFVCYYQFNSSQVQYYAYARVYLHASYIGMASGVPTGDGVVSGTAAGSATPHHRGFIQTFTYAATTRWTMYADGATFILINAATQNSSPSLYPGPDFENSSNAGSETLYVGDDSNGFFIAAGGYTGAPSQFLYRTRFSATDLTVLRNPVSGLLVDTGGVAAEIVGIKTPIGILSQANTWSKPTLNLAPVAWLCAGVEQGYLRGMGIDPALHAQWAYTVKNILDGTAITHNVQQILVPSVLQDGYRYQALLAGNDLRKAAVITDNPEFW